ncbi:MAG: cell division protein ZapA [Spirosomataceae bacterium]
MEPKKSRPPINVTIGNKSYELRSDSEDEEQLIRMAAKLVTEQIEYRMKRKKGEVNREEILSMVCLDAMVARLKGDHDLEIIKNEVFKNLDTIQNHFSPSGQN